MQNAKFKPQKPLRDDEKRAVLASYIKEHDLPIFIETGTYMGGTTRAMSQLVRDVYTVELSMHQFRISKQALEGIDNVRMHLGDSATELAEILKNVDDRCLIWLDAHYSGGQTAYREKKTPMLDELNAIKAHTRNDHVVLIDDIRAFIEKDSYPDVEVLIDHLQKINDEYVITIVDDILRAVPAAKEKNGNA